MAYNKTCPYCGTSLADFYRTSMLGCPKCYDEFKAEIRVVAKRMHGKTEHVGKNPNNVGIDHELLFEYKNLLEEKERALMEGRFDDMIKISSNIKQLEEELHKRGLK